MLSVSHTELRSFPLITSTDCIIQWAITILFLTLQLSFFFMNVHSCQPSNGDVKIASLYLENCAYFY